MCLRDRVAVGDCELERELDVLARRGPVATAPVTAGAPLVDVGAEAVGGAAAHGEDESLGEERLCALYLRALVLAAGRPVEDVREGRVVAGEGSSTAEPLERHLQLAEVHPCPALDEERAHLEDGGPRHAVEQLVRLRVLVALD